MNIQIVKYHKIALVLLVVVFLIFVLWEFLISDQLWILAPTHKPYPIESLNQIIPGHTNLSDALVILGSPDSIEDSSYHPTRLFNDIFERQPYYKVYIFLDKQEWHRTELWIQDRGFDQLVVAVLRYLPINIRDFANNPSLDDFIAYGRPDEVLWSSSCFFRYLIWLNEGIAVDAGTQLYIPEKGIHRSYAWNEIPVFTILLFDPRNSKNLTNITKWPWPNNGAAWNPSNAEWNPSCNEDRAPKDSFDWESFTIHEP